MNFFNQSAHISIVPCFKINSYVNACIYKLYSLTQRQYILNLNQVPMHQVHELLVP